MMRRGLWRRLAPLGVLFAAAIALRLSGAGDELTLEGLRANRLLFEAFVRERPASALIVFVLTYVTVTALSLPGSAMLSVLGGYLFGTAAAAASVVVAATAGASLAFLSARYAAGGWITAAYGDRLSRFNEEIGRHGRYYLLTLRLVPVFPFFLINFFAGLTAVPLSTFVWTTAVGIIPGSVVFTYAGSSLAGIRTVEDILSGSVIAALTLLGLFALVPVFVGRRKKRETPS